MKLDELHPLNALVIRSLRDRKPDHEAIASPDSHGDPYYGLGSHPDIVQHVWEILGQPLPVDCRAIVYGTPSLVRPEAGLILAVCYGTAYVMRVPHDLIDTALAAGCRIETTWSGGEKTNIEYEFGRGWIFGGFLKHENEWLQRTFHDAVAFSC